MREEGLEEPDLLEDVEVAVVARLERREALARAEQLFGALDARVNECRTKPKKAKKERRFHRATFRAISSHLR